jgi:hypothetical protein
MPNLERFPISFKTYFSGNYFRHIVLGVNFGGRYGALGMSRREDLMYKPPAFRTLSELVLDYEAAYGRCWHVLKKVKLGRCWTWRGWAAMTSARSWSATPATCGSRSGSAVAGKDKGAGRFLLGFPHHHALTLLPLPAGEGVST